MFDEYPNRLTPKSLKLIDIELVSDHDKTLPTKFDILHMVDGVVNSTKNCFNKNMIVNFNPVTGI